MNHAKSSCSCKKRGSCPSLNGNKTTLEDTTKELGHLLDPSMIIIKTLTHNLMSKSKYSEALQSCKEQAQKDHYQILIIIERFGPPIAHLINQLQRIQSFANKGAKTRRPAPIDYPPLFNHKSNLCVV